VSQELVGHEDITLTRGLYAQAGHENVQARTSLEMMVFMSRVGLAVAFDR
jgi:hypothetical protein